MAGTHGAALERYAPLIRDWDAFVRAATEPRPTCLVANANRIGAEALAGLLDAEACPVEPVQWTHGALRVPPHARPGGWWPAQAGLYQIQEEASLLPAHLLAPKPGERVLDMCAAPGGKAAQLAMALGSSGTVLANDKDSRRLAAVRDKMKRLGLLNLTACVHDAGDFPLAAGMFDRVLVDAPCSAEGTKARSGAGYRASDTTFRHWVNGQQRALLRRAVKLTRPGGRIVYATCSFAPEENEAVVEAVLHELPGEVYPVQVNVGSLPADPGVPVWNDHAFDQEVVENAARLWPHRSGTGGFFAIALERPANAAVHAPDPAAVEPAAPGTPTDRAAVLDPLTHRFGLDAEALAGLKLWEAGDHVHATAVDHHPPARPRPTASGVPFTRRGAHWPKPTTAAALMLGDAASRNVIALDRDQVDAYQARRAIQPRPEQLAACDGRGHVLLHFRGVSLGVGFLHPGDDDAPATIESQFPRAWMTQPG